MSAPGFTAADAERQAGQAAAGYFARSLRILAERLGLEKTLADNPAGFAEKFAPLLAALIAAQATEYQSWVFFARLGEIDDSLCSGLGELAGCLEETNAQTCKSCLSSHRGRQ